MSTRRLIGLVGILSLVIALPLSLPGCGGSAQEVGPDGEVKLAPGTVDLSKEYEQAGPGAKKPK